MDLNNNLGLGVEFQAEVDTVLFTFRPVKRCPEMSRDRYGAIGECLGVWSDLQVRGANYRFCPKSEHAQSGLNEPFWNGIKWKAQYELERQIDRDNAHAKQRRIGAALILLEEIEKLASGDRQYLQDITAAISKAKNSL